MFCGCTTEGVPLNDYDLMSINYRVKESDLFVDKECVRHPDETDVFRPHHQLVDPKVHRVEGEPGVGPELAEVHVEGEVHVLLGEVADGEDVEGDANGDGDPSIVGPDPPIVANLERVEDVRDVDRRGFPTSVRLRFPNHFGMMMMMIIMLTMVMMIMTMHCNDHKLPDSVRLGFANHQLKIH